MVFLPLGQVVGWIAWVFLTYTIEVVRLTARVPFALTPVQMGGWMMWGYYALLGGLTWCLAQPREKKPGFFPENLVSQCSGNRDHHRRGAGVGGDGAVRLTSKGMVITFLPAPQFIFGTGTADVKELVIRETDKPPTSSNNTVARAAFKVTLGGLFRLVVGISKQVILAYIFGAGVAMDAYLTAFVIPIYLRTVLLTGLSYVIIPAFVQLQTAEREDDAWALVGTFFWLIGGLLAVVAIGGSLFSQSLIALFAPGLNPGKADLAARMLAVLMFSVPLAGLGSLTRGIQNARNHFFWPVTSTAIGAVGNVLVLLVLYRTVGPLSLAWGYLVAATLQACVTLIPVLRHGWTRLMPLRDSRVREMVRLMLPFVLFGILTYSTSLFERYYASGLPDGDLSYLGYASKISEIMMALIGAGIAAAIFPAMARAYVQTGEGGLVEKAEYGLRLTLAVAMPAWAIVSAVAVPLVTFLFERGAFQHTATCSVSRIVPIVMIGAVVFPMVGGLISRAYYVTRDTHTVSIVAAVTSGLYILLARVLVDTWGYVGLAWARPLCAGLTILVLSWLLTRRLRSLHTGKLLRETLMYGAASLVVFLAAWLVVNALAFLPALLQSLAAFLVAGPLYMAILFRIDREIAVSVLEMTGVRRMVVGARAAIRLIAETSQG